MSRSEGHIHSPARPLEPLRSVFESSEGSRRPTVNIAKALHLGLNAIYFTSQRHCVITQPDHESGNQRIRSLFGRMMCARTASRASQRKPQPKFFKQHRGFAGSLVVSKSLYITDAYAWRRGRDSNPRYGCPYAAFRVRCYRPLSHLSVAGRDAMPASVWLCNQRGAAKQALRIGPVPAATHRGLTSAKFRACSVNPDWARAS